MTTGSPARSSRALVKALGLGVEHQDAGFGMGWIQDGRSLLRKNPRLAPSDLDAPRLFADIPARAFVAAMRPPEDGVVTPKDLQPFRFRKWVWVQQGWPLALQDRREELVGQLSDSLARNLAGSGSDELLFHMFLDALRPRNVFRAPVAEGPPCAEALAEAVSRAGEQRGTDGEPLQILTLTERLLLGLCLDAPLHLRLIRGLTVKPERPLFAGHRPPPHRAPPLQGPARHLRAGPGAR